MSELTNTLHLKKVSELLTDNFFIRSYQRGYRWTENQVKDLLNDINEFTPQSCKDITSWYCLQPLVVKEMDKLSKVEYKLDTTKTWYEVIDGQQRLTTLFLIIHYANEMWIGRAKVPEPNINYETREGSTQFLSDLKVEDDNKTIKINKECIDFFHMSSAYETIHNWVLSLGDHFDSNGFQSKLKEYTKVIWYEIEQNVNSISVFTRLNMGKIRLTNAELIKALLLSQSALSIENYEAMKLKQLEIAAEWDLIEKELNNIDFWAFITNEKSDNYYTKIELLLELSAGIAHSDSALDLFNHYAAKSNRDTILDLWEELVANFEILKEWYNDRKKYHLIGYLIFQSRKTDVSGLILESKIKGKNQFIADIKNKIKDLIVSVRLEDLDYNKTPDAIHKVLTLFNVLSVMNTKESLLRFPFSKHKGSGLWSLEHIYAQNSQGLNSAKAWRSWLEDHKRVLDSNGKYQELTERIGKLLQVIDDVKVLDRKQQFDSLFSDISVALDSCGEEEAMHSIENMALLLRDDNSTLNNSVFAVKRQKILELDKSGAYIPICTRNVFLKYYTPDATDVYCWSIKDREAYLKEIKLVLRDYLAADCKTPSTPN